MIRRVDSFALLLILSGGIVLELGAAVLANAWLFAGGRVAAATLLRTCVLLLSLHLPGSILLLVWLLLALELAWISGRLLRELYTRCQRTHRVVAHLRKDLAATPPALARLAVSLSLLDRIHVVDSDESVSFCHGMFSPRILVSTGLLRRLDRPELEAVLLHEREHLLRRDPLRALLAQSLAAALRWMPLIPALAERLLAEQEIMADRAVVAAQSGPQHLASAMLRLITATDSSLSLSGLALSGLSACAARIEALAEPGGASCRLPVPAGSVRGGMAITSAGTACALAFTLLVHGAAIVSYCAGAAHMALHCF